MALAVLLGGAGAATGCSDDPATAASEARNIEPLSAPGVPHAINGLAVVREDITTQLEGFSRPYLAQAALYSMRDGEELKATLQIGRFAEGVELDQDFRDSIITAIGAGSAREVRVGDHQVFLTAGDRQQLAFWFEAGDIYILSTRDDYTGSRRLLRDALEVHP